MIKINAYISEEYFVEKGKIVKYGMVKRMKFFFTLGMVILI